MRRFHQGTARWVSLSVGTCTVWAVQYQIWIRDNDNTYRKALLMAMEGKICGCKTARSAVGKTRFTESAG